MRASQNVISIGTYMYVYYYFSDNKLIVTLFTSNFYYPI